MNFGRYGVPVNGSYDQFQEVLGGVRRTQFRMFLHRHPLLRRWWVNLVGWIGHSLWRLAGSITHHYHDLTAFYFMLAVGGEEKYAHLGQKLTEKKNEGS